MDPAFKLNPPKYCQQCAQTGLITKVKKLRLNALQESYTIMCLNKERPWPFSTLSDPSEDEVISSANEGETDMEITVETVETIETVEKGIQDLKQAISELKSIGVKENGQ